MVKYVARFENSAQSVLASTKTFQKYLAFESEHQRHLCQPTCTPKPARRPQPELLFRQPIPSQLGIDREPDRPKEERIEVGLPATGLPGLELAPFERISTTEKTDESATPQP